MITESRFFKRGIKLTDSQEAEIESKLLGPPIVSQDIPQEGLGVLLNITDSCEQYSNFLIDKFPFRKPGDPKLKLIIDLANGASVRCAPWSLIQIFLMPGLSTAHPTGSI